MFDHSFCILLGYMYKYRVENGQWFKKSEILEMLQFANQEMQHKTEWKNT